MRYKSYRNAFLISVVALIMALLVNELNLYHLKKDGIKIRENQTIITADDYSYLFPYNNLIEHGSFYVNDYDKHLSVIRSPGYGFHYYLFVKIFGLPHGLFILKIWQLLLFAISIFCFYYLALDLLKSEKWAFFTAFIYGILPISSGFLYYTLTESISPALLLIFLAILNLAQKQTQIPKKHVLYFFASLLFSYLFITRPFLSLFGLAIPLFIWIDANLKVAKIKKLSFVFLYTLVGLSFMLTWQIRNKMVLGKFTSLHPIYQNELPGTFRLSHLAMWNFYKTWESSGANFHQSTLGIWNQTLAGDTSDVSVNKTIQQIPEKYKKELGESNLYQAFKSYQKAIYAQRDYALNRKLMPSEILEEEKIAIQHFEKLERKFKQKFFLTNYLITPAKVFKNLTFHSNLSLYIFQNTYRGAFLMELLRWLSFLLHALAFTFFLLFLFTKQPKENKFIYFFLLTFYVFYLIYVQRGIEERYTLPLLPFAILSAVAVVKEFSRKIMLQKWF
jgi:hypothetical protein